MEDIEELDDERETPSKKFIKDLGKMSGILSPDIIPQSARRRKLLSIDPYSIEYEMMVREEWDNRDNRDSKKHLYRFKTFGEFLAYRRRNK
jgi:hypothetical protein